MCVMADDDKKFFDDWFSTVFIGFLACVFIYTTLECISRCDAGGIGLAIICAPIALVFTVIFIKMLFD